MFNVQVLSVPSLQPDHLFDEEGFIVNPDLWTKTMASQLAENVGIHALQEPHWNIINFLRDRYLSIGAIPPMRRICREFGYDKGRVKSLFGGCRQLWQIAGLPHPGEEALAYMD